MATGSFADRSVLTDWPPLAKAAKIYLNPVHPGDSKLILVWPDDPREVGFLVGQRERRHDLLLLDRATAQVGKPEFDSRIGVANLEQKVGDVTYSVTRFGDFSPLWHWLEDKLVNCLGFASYLAKCCPIWQNLAKFHCFKNSQIFKNNSAVWSYWTSNVQYFI